MRLGSQGLRTGPVCDVWLAPEKQRSSQTDLPVTVTPASSRRVTTVASRDGTKPSIRREPLAIGTPATAVLSLTASVRPASGPSGAPSMRQRAYQAPHRFSPSAGHDHSRCGAAGAWAAQSSSTRS